jgi:hypothetical protein
MLPDNLKVWGQMILDERQTVFAGYVMSMKLVIASKVYKFWQVFRWLFPARA